MLSRDEIANQWSINSVRGERRCRVMKKAKYVAPKVVGSASVHPC